MEEGRPLPMVRVVCVGSRRKLGSKNEERRAVIEYIVRELKADLFAELMQAVY